MHFLVEAYVAWSDDAPEIAARAHRAAAELSREGTAVRFIRSLYVPEDETCFHIFEAPSAEAVGRVTKRASIGYVRIIEALAFPAERTPRPGGP